MCQACGSSLASCLLPSAKSNILNMVYKTLCGPFSVHLPSLILRHFPLPTLLSSHTVFLLLPLRSHTYSYASKHLRNTVPLPGILFFLSPTPLLFTLPVSARTTFSKMPCPTPEASLASPSVDSHPSHPSLSLELLLLVATNSKSIFRRSTLESPQRLKPGLTIWSLVLSTVSVTELVLSTYGSWP